MNLQDNIKKIFATAAQNQTSAFAVAISIIDQKRAFLTAYINAMGKGGSAVQPLEIGYNVNQAYIFEITSRRVSNPILFTQTLIQSQNENNYKGFRFARLLDNNPDALAACFLTAPKYLKNDACALVTAAILKFTPTAEHAEGGMFGRVGNEVDSGDTTVTGALASVGIPASPETVHAFRKKLQDISDEVGDKVRGWLFGTGLTHEWNNHEGSRFKCTNDDWWKARAEYEKNTGIYQPDDILDMLTLIYEDPDSGVFNVNAPFKQRHDLWAQAAGRDWWKKGPADFQRRFEMIAPDVWAAHKAQGKLTPEQYAYAALKGDLIGFRGAVPKDADKAQTPTQLSFLARFFRALFKLK